jgi:hypothetical protein
MSPWQLEVFKTALALVVLLFTWRVGQRILLVWDRRKKRQELDILAAERFQQLYGDLKEVSRLWRSASRPQGNAPTPPSTLQWDLLAKATAAESKYETLVIKLASERALSPSQVRTLGLFRQAAQEVRQSIREGLIVPASGFGSEYLAFNDLAAEVACLLNAEPTFEYISAATARRRLEDIALTRSRDWQALVREYTTSRLPIFAETSAGATRS